ncbi:MAG: exo-alpha-sialidase, partial [Saprospiraceae bacterium]|nr:exo-alpha-sialidase [Saprospiraceae bacterium]
PLDTVINSAADEYFPAVASNGNLYFTTTRKTGIGREDIFMSKYEKGKYQVPQPLDTAINSPLYEFNAFVSADEKLIIFTSYARSDDLGGGDLYFSTKDSSGKWRMAKNLGPEINSTKLDYCPFMYTANSGFYFTSERDQMDHDTLNSVADFEQFSDDVLNGLGNIYHVNAKIFATSN